MLKTLREYLTLGSLATVAAVVGIGSGIYSMTRGGGGGSTGQGGTSGYVPQGQPGADQNWQDMMRRMMEVTGMSADQLTPMLQRAFGQMTNGDLAGQYGQFGDTSQRVAENFRSAQGDLQGAGSRMWLDSLDPLNTLHDKLGHQTEQGSRAATSARGIGMSPQAAGLENEAMGNFETNWQQGMLGREQMGLQGLTSAYQGAGQQGMAGQAALGQAANFYGQRYQLPFDAANMYSGAMNQGVYGPWNQLMGNNAQYMGMGANAAQANFGQQQTGLNNFTTGLNRFANSPGWGQIQQFFGRGGGGGGGDINWNTESGLG